MAISKTFQSLIIFLNREEDTYLENEPFYVTARVGSESSTQLVENGMRSLESGT